MKKILFAFCGAFIACAATAADLVGTASVRMTSDTSSTAKTMAINDARRQILIDKLRPYASSDQLSSAIRNAKSADLANLISETSIDGEQISDTTYSANITMTVDRNAARKWMAENNVYNWLSDGSVVSAFTMHVTLSNPISDWAQLQSIARSERVDFSTKQIVGNIATIDVPTSARSSVTIALRNAGWKTAADDGFMRVWK
ncbi:MAG: hypothetical protein J6Y49_02945 [Alphaproteobacteria bacterium]|nr:hypothetical protein [Alphaproteobacteria bacterium]